MTELEQDRKVEAARLESARRRGTVHRHHCPKCNQDYDCGGRGCAPARELLCVECFYQQEG
jgi:hypothetical protein